MITWYAAAEALLHPHELDAINRGLPQPGHDLADDEQGPTMKVSIGELMRYDDGTVIVRTHDGQDRIIGHDGNGTEPDVGVPPDEEVPGDQGAMREALTHALDRNAELANELAQLRAQIAAAQPAPSQPAQPSQTIVMPEPTKE